MGTFDLWLSGSSILDPDIGETLKTPSVNR
jgi:hypothetical protein